MDLIASCGYVETKPHREVILNEQIRAIVLQQGLYSLLRRTGSSWSRQKLNVGIQFVPGSFGLPHLTRTNRIMKSKRGVRSNVKNVREKVSDLPEYMQFVTSCAVYLPPYGLTI